MRDKRARLVVIGGALVALGVLLPPIAPASGSVQPRPMAVIPMTTSPTSPLPGMTATEVRPAQGTPLPGIPRSNG